MKIKNLLNASLLCVALGLSSLAQATPITYEFNTPAWTASQDTADKSLGTSGMLSITVDATGSNAFKTSDFLSVSFVAVGGSVNHTWLQTDGFGDNGLAADDPDYLSSDPVYLTVDANGLATFDLKASNSPDSYGFYGFLNDNGYRLTFYVDGAAFFIGTSDANAQSVAFTVSNNVPEPASLALAGVALAGLAVARRRRQA